MGEKTGIEWCDSTFNPWIGCTKISPACTNCYAAAYGNRFGVAWGKGQPRRRTSPAKWLEPLAWNRKAKRTGERPRVFCSSLADWLDDEVPASWLAELLVLVHQTQALRWLLLTKRPELWRSRIEAALGALEDGTAMPPSDGAAIATANMIRAWLGGDRPNNVWVGTTVEDQRRADERLPALYRIPARVVFLSCEPLLGPLALNLDRAFPRVEWIIAGGESGPSARPTHPEWFRSLRDQAVAADVPFFFKQHGEWAPSPGTAPRRAALAGKLEAWTISSSTSRERGYATGAATWHAIPSDVREDGFGPVEALHNVGKVAAGCELDGRTWDELPEVADASRAQAGRVDAAHLAAVDCGRPACSWCHPEVARG